MRALAVLIVLVFLGGCSAASLMPKGAGQNVYSEDIARESALQETYAGILCRDNGLPHYPSASGAPACDYPRMTSGHWAIFVNAGLYDIDRRCDAYLEWLFEARRLRDPISNQLGRTGNLTTALLRAFDAANLTIEVVGLAFGYAQDTFTSFDPNLLWGVETSTVQKLVLDRQTNAKTAISDIQFSSKPQAMHALRGYLRICMPFTIETDINTTLVAGTEMRVVTGGPVQIDADTVGASLRADSPIVLPDRGASIDVDDAARAVFSAPAGKNIADVILVQRMLCDDVPNGQVLGGTKIAIAAMEDALGANATVNDLVDDTEYRLIKALGDDCNSQIHWNFYERTFLEGPQLRIFISDLKTLYPDLELAPDLKYSDPQFPKERFREAVAKARKDHSLKVNPIIPAKQVTLAVFTQVRELAKKKRNGG